MDMFSDTPDEVKQKRETTMFLMFMERSKDDIMEEIDSMNKLTMAVVNGDQAMIEYMLRRLHPDALKDTTSSGKTPVDWAIIMGNMVATRKLFAAQAKAEEEEYANTIAIIELEDAARHSTTDTHATESESGIVSRIASLIMAPDTRRKRDATTSAIAPVVVSEQV